MNRKSVNNYRILHTKNQYEVLGNIEKDTTTGWMTALVRVKDPNGRLFLPQPVTRSRLIQRGMGVLAFLYDYDAGLQDDDLVIVKKSLLSMFSEPSDIVEQAEKLSEREVVERLKEYIQIRNNEGTVVDKEITISPDVFIKDEIGYIKTTVFENFISENKDMGWKRLEVLKMLKREGLLVTDKGKVYQKKVKRNGRGKDYYAVKFSEEEENE